MADEIKQELGFDATQALETINKLNSGFDSLFQTLNASSRAFDSFNTRGEQTVNTLAKIAAQVNATSSKLTGAAAGNALDQLLGGGGSGKDALKADRDIQALRENFKSTAAEAQNLGVEVSKTGAATTNAMNQSARSTAGFALSLETVTRVLGTQVIVRTLGLIQRGITDSFGDFIELQNKIGAIRTISSDSISSLEKELGGLSNQFNVPLLDVVDAKYEILQNDFISAADSADVLTATLKLARITNISAADSPTILTSALNASGEAASSAELEAAKLVKTIELGRIKGPELASALGRVKPVAEELGASNDEILAAFSSITIGGVKTAEAATQIRASLTSLLKPSEDMEAVFKKLGVATGDQAIQTFGYRGALEAAIATTDGSTASIAKLFPNVRALTGVLREAGSGADVFDEHLKKIRQTSVETLNQKYHLRIETDAEQVTADLNKLKNFLTTEVGRTLTETAAEAIKFVGGIDSIISVSRALVPVLGTATAGLVAYGLAAGLASANSKLFAASTAEGTTLLKRFGGALAIVGAAFAAFEAGKALGQIITDNLNEEQKALVESGQHRLEVERAHDARQAELAKGAAEDKVKLINQTIAREQAAYNTELDVAKDKNQLLIEDDKSTLDRIIQAHEKFANDLRRAAQSAEDQVIKSKEISNDQIAKLSDERFQNETAKLDQLGQFQSDQSRGQQIAALGLKQLLTAHTEKEAEAGRKTLDRADGYKKQAIELAKGLGFIATSDDLERQRNRIIEQRIQAELKFQKIREADAVKLRAAAAEEDKRNDKIKGLAKTFLDNSKLFDNKGNRLPEDEVTKRANKARDALDQLQKLLLAGNKNVSISDLFSFDDLQRRIDEKVTGADLKQLTINQSAQDGLIEQIQGTIDKHGKFVVDVAVGLGANPEDFKNLSRPEAFQKATEQNQDSTKDRAKLVEADLKRRDLEREIVEAQAEAEASLKRQLTTKEALSIVAQKAISDPFQTGQQDFAENFVLVAQLRATIQDGLKDKNLTQEFVDHLGAQLEEITKTAPISLNIDVGKATREFQSLKQVLDFRGQIKDLDDKGLTPEALQQSNAQLQNTAERARLEGLVAGSLQLSANAMDSVDKSSAAYLNNLREIQNTPNTLFNDKFNAAKAAADQGIPADQAIQLLQNPSFQTKAPVSVEPNPNDGASIQGSTNVNATINVTSNDPAQFARDLIPAINRELRRNASALRTA